MQELDNTEQTSTRKMRGAALALTIINVGKCSSVTESTITGSRKRMVTEPERPRIAQHRMRSGYE